MTFSANGDQQQFIDTPPSPTASVVCVAGPGTGKTATAIAHCQLYNGLDCSRFLFIPFTRAATIELQQRMADIGYPAADLGKHVMTLHAFCGEILTKVRTDASALLKSPAFGHSRTRAVEDVLSLFDDTVEYRRHLFAHVVRSLRPCVSTIYIDEVQDLCPVQMKVVKHLCDVFKSGLFAIGDPRQSIYGFQGADPELMMTLSQGGRELKVLMLGENYRSSQEIVDFANVLIEQMRVYGGGVISPRLLGCMDTPLTKTVMPVGRRPGERPTVRAFATADDECDWIAGEIKMLTTLSGILPGEIAILSRTRFTGARCFPRLLARGIDCTLRVDSSVGDDELHRDPELSRLKAESQVTVTTIHNSKGCEWRAVFVCGACDVGGRGGMPSALDPLDPLDPLDSLDPPGGEGATAEADAGDDSARAARHVGEELRVLFTGVTRAKDILHLTYTTESYGSGADDVTATRFITEDMIARGVVRCVTPQVHAGAGTVVPVTTRARGVHFDVPLRAEKVADHLGSCEEFIRHVYENESLASSLFEEERVIPVGDLFASDTVRSDIWWYHGLGGLLANLIEYSALLTGQAAFGEAGIGIGAPPAPAPGSVSGGGTDAAIINCFKSQYNLHLSPFLSAHDFDVATAVGECPACGDMWLDVLDNVLAHPQGKPIALPDFCDGCKNISEKPLEKIVATYRTRARGICRQVTACPRSTDRQCKPVWGKICDLRAQCGDSRARCRTPFRRYIHGIDAFTASQRTLSAECTADVRRLYYAVMTGEGSGEQLDMLHLYGLVRERNFEAILRHLTAGKQKNGHLSMNRTHVILQQILKVVHTQIEALRIAIVRHAGIISAVRWNTQLGALVSVDGEDANIDVYLCKDAGGDSVVVEEETQDDQCAVNLRRKSVFNPHIEDWHEPYRASSGTGGEKTKYVGLYSATRGALILAKIRSG
jgi:hypothetical protein